MGLIQYADKDKTGIDPINKWRDIDANEVKNAVNTNFDANSFWPAVPGAPARVNNTSFTIADVANANKYDKLISNTVVLKWTDSGSVKMAMVVSAVYAADVVTVTIMGDVLAATATTATLRYAKEKCKPIAFAIAGTIAVGTDLTGHWYAPCEMKVFGANAYHGTAGTTNPSTYDVNKNGATMFTSKISIASGATAGTGFTADNGVTLAANDSLSVDCASVSTTAPVDLYLYLFAFPLNNQYL